MRLSQPPSRAARLIEAKVPAYDLKGKYDAFNARLFDGKLPTYLVPVWASLKDRGGDTRFQYQGSQVEPGTLRVRISSLYERPEQAFDSVLIHEMIHVYFATIGDFHQNHGPKFVAMAKALGDIVGFEIPLTDSMPRTALTRPREKSIGVFLFMKTSGMFAFAMVEGSRMQTENLAGYLEGKVKLGGACQGWAFTILTPKWAEAAALYGVQRKPVGSLQYYMVNRFALVNELREQGTVLASYPLKAQVPSIDAATCRANMEAWTAELHKYLSASDAVGDQPTPGAVVEQLLAESRTLDSLGVVRATDLPDDMQVLLDDFMVKVPAFLPVAYYRVASMPEVELDPYDRGEEHARAMVGSETPPILLAGDHVLDGKHRIWAARQAGQQTIAGVDLASIGKLRRDVLRNSLGRLQQPRKAA